MANNCASAYYFCIPHHESFKREEIKQLWQCGLLGTSNPQARLNAVFFYNGFQFCLRGGLEHRRLKLQQIKRDDMGYTYYENGSKNRKGVPLKKKHCQQGCMVWCSAQARERCHVLFWMFTSASCQRMHTGWKVFTFDHCLSLIWLMVHSSTNWKEQNWLPWCRTCVKMQAYRRKRTTVTRATALFEVDVSKNIIQERTGHRSWEALRQYEQSTTLQHRATSKILIINTGMEYQVAV